MANKALVAELNLNIKKFTAQLNRAERRAKTMGQKGGKAGGMALGKGLKGGVAGALVQISGNIVKTVTIAAAAAGAVFARVIQRSTQEAGQIEAAEMRFNILTGDAEKSNQVLTQLRQTAMRTGITFEAMAGNVGKFMAFGFSPEKAMELNKGILDVGGAVGMTNTDMKLLGVALSQVAAKGVGSMEELRQQIAEKGIPIFKALEEQLGVTGAELNKMIQEGKVSADVVLGLFTDVAKGKGPLKDFAGGADKMATTFQGKIGRMKATWGEFLKQLGEPIIEALMPIMDDILIIFERMISEAPDLGKKIGAIIARLENFTDPIARMSESLNGFQMAWDAFVDYALASFANGLVRGIIVAFSALGVQLMSLVHRLANLLYTVFADADFGNALWMGVSSWIGHLGSALGGIAASFVRKLEEIIPFLKRFGLSDKIQNQANQAGLDADALAAGSLNHRDAYEREFGARADEFNQYWGDQLKDFMSNLNDPQTGLDVAGSRAMRERLQEILDGLQPRPKPEQVELDPAEEDPKNPLGAATGGGFALNGRVDQMNNALMGRNAFAVIAIEAQKAHEQRERGLGLLKVIAENTAPLADDGSVGFNAGASGAFA